MGRSLRYPIVKMTQSAAMELSSYLANFDPNPECIDARDAAKALRDQFFNAGQEGQAVELKLMVEG